MKLTLPQQDIYFEQLLCLLQPFTPFIAEELWHLLRERKEGEDIIIASWPKEETYNKEVLQQFGIAEEVIIHIRNIRKQNNIGRFGGSGGSSRPDGDTDIRKRECRRIIDAIAHHRHFAGLPLDAGLQGRDVL